MITTSEIAPSPALAPFVRCYTFREFDTKGSDLLKPWHASHEISMPFFFKALPIKLTDPGTGHIVKEGTYGGITGLSTHYNGEMTFNGCYSFFEIIFKPGGFFHLFRIHCSEITNKIMDADDVLDSGVKSFYDQLCHANGLAEMAGVADAYLLSFLKQQKAKSHKDAITASANTVLRSAGIVSVDKLAYMANMSIRNFERQFTNQVGIPPKLFSNITRFNHALELKLKYPKKDWTSIAMQYGYFDQTHLIKEFKKFSGNTPSTFLKVTPLTKEIYTNRVEL